MARSLTNSGADADDVLQEATVRLLRFIHGYRGGDSRSWVMRVARNTAITWLRTHRARNHPEWDPESVVDEQFSMPFGAAVAVLDGAACLDQFTIEKSRSQKVRDLMTKVVLVKDPRIEETFPREWPARPPH